MDTKKLDQNDLADKWWERFETWYENNRITRILIILNVIIYSLLYMVLLNN